MVSHHRWHEYGWHAQVYKKKVGVGGKTCRLLSTQLLTVKLTNFKKGKWKEYDGCKTLGRWCNDVLCFCEVWKGFMAPPNVFKLKFSVGKEELKSKNTLQHVKLEALIIIYPSSTQKRQVKICLGECRLFFLRASAHRSQSPAVWPRHFLGRRSMCRNRPLGTRECELWREGNRHAAEWGRSVIDAN